jgi:hypothetical protein
MILAHHKIYLYITMTTSFLNNFRSLFNQYPIMNNPSAILPVASFPQMTSMLQVCINLFLGLICRLISMLTLSDPLIKRFYAQKALAGFATLNAYNLWAPIFHIKPANSLIFHLREVDHLRITVVTLLSSSLSIISHIFSSCFTPFGCIAA